MAIFGKLDLEKTVQVNDKTRLGATRSFISKDEAAVTLVEIDADGAGFVDVTGSTALDWYLDFSFATDGAKTISCRITTDGGPVTITETLTVLSVVDDALFSSDGDLVEKEPDILNFLRAGRNSFLDKHRKAQSLIMEHFKEIGIKDTSGARLTKAAVVDVSEVQNWSCYLALHLIYEDLWNSADDVFKAKSDEYKSRAFNAQSRQDWKLDLDGSGTISSNEGVHIASSFMTRS